MKNLVVCCDGTGNQTGLEGSHVLRIQRLAERCGPDQIVHYDFGVGTQDKPDPWHMLSQHVAIGLGLATGDRLDTKVIKAYEFLAENYEDGARIFIFGFSRGAYAARILAAMIHKIGLLPPNKKDMAGKGLIVFEQFSKTHWDEDTAKAEMDLAKDDAYLFARNLCSRWITIEFVGVWDTVASLIRPNPEKFFLPSLTHLTFTRRNPSVKIFRQAIAIDERRRMFRLDPWKEPQNFCPQPLDKTSHLPQDIAQVWFAGVHADVGGGLKEEISGLSKFSLIWMVEEAMKAGLSINRELYNRLAWGKNLKDIRYVGPIFAEPQDSMSEVWRILEFLPKADKHKEWSDRRSLLGHYIPNAEPRYIPEGALIHESAFGCMKAFPTYRPSNLPNQYRKVPMSSPPENS